MGDIYTYIFNDVEAKNESKSYNKTGFFQLDSKFQQEMKEHGFPTPLLETVAFPLLLRGGLFVSYIELAFRLSKQHISNVFPSKEVLCQSYK